MTDMTEWNVTYSYLAGAPEKFECVDDDDLLRQVQAFADAKRVRADRPAIGKLEMDGYTDQIDFFFRRNGRRLRFMIVMA